VSEARFSAAVIRQRQEGGWLLGVVGKRTYTVVRGRCHVAPSQPALVEDPDVDQESGRLRHDSDLIINRLATDIILNGTARAPTQTNIFTVTLRIGDFVREISVSGERHLQQRSDGRLTFTKPEPVDQVPLTWDEAYGGVDLVGLAEIGDPFVAIAAKTDTPIGPTQSLFAYPRNPYGKGYLIEASPAAIEACRLPRLEYPSSRVTPENIVRTHFVTWPRAPIPVGAEWLAYSMFPRTAQLGMPVALYDEAAFPPEQFPEVKTGVLRADSLDSEAPIGKRIDVAALAQGSAVGMRAGVEPASKVDLTNVHPEQSLWSFQLPSEVPRMAYRLPGQKAAEMAPRIHRLSLDPDRNSVTLLWVATLPLEEPLTPKQTESIEHAVIWP
jgi:hypothetical protein